MRELKVYMFDWDNEKILTIITHNYTSNGSAINWLRIVELVKAECTIDQNFIHITCIAHNLKFIIQKDLKELDDSITK